jgi:signal transduction histidine kinase
LRPAVRRALLVFGGWTLYAVVVAYLFHAWRSRTGEPHPPYWGLAHYWLVTAWLWALLTLAIVPAARRFPITAANWLVRGPLHLAFAVVTHVVHAVVLWAIHPYVRPGPRPEMPGSLFGALFFDLFVYATLVAIVLAGDAQRQTLRLRTELLESELNLMRMQIQPHFLFNTLNAVSELIHVDPARAERALARLGDLLRWSLQSAGLHEVPLREELDALECYLEIQRLRHGDALVFRIEADAETLGLAVPSLLLQPLVENAIRHGVRGLPAGTVAVRARREGDRLALAVEDDGRGIATGFREGLGLRTTRARLAGLYGTDQELRVAPGPSGGSVIDVRLPARAAPVAGQGGRS